MLGSRFVAATLDATVLLLVGPRFGIGVDRNAMVTPQGQEVNSWMIVVFQVFGEVGRATEFAYERVPGSSPVVGLAQFTN